LIGLDTNILVRFFTHDDPCQVPHAERLMKSLTRTEPGWIALATILELVWVITSKAGGNRREVIPILDFLLARDEIVIEQSSVIESALQKFRSGNADFADCLIAASAAAAGCSRTVTFDRIAARDTGMQLIG